MSNIYIQEPPSSGKVLLKTTAGDIDIELWSKEAPKACRNFIQLCLEGYYDNTIFHRVVPGFIVQGGDPTRSGTGGESIYGKPFKDEFHSRLRFNRRGLVAMANAGPHDNGSQFFFTLGPADELNNKHTIFGKVTGDTIYNILRLAEVEIDKDERPISPHKIKSTEVLHNSFDDIVPRVLKKHKKEKREEEVKKSYSKGTKNFSLLSFGEEAEEEEEEVNRVSQSMKGKSKSSHDLLKDDPRLSSVPVVESEPGTVKTKKGSDKEEDDESDDEECEQMKEQIAKKLKKDKNEDVKFQHREDDDVDEKKKLSRSEELRKEARQLKREILAAKQKKSEILKKEEEPQEIEQAPNSAVAEYLNERKKYEELRRQKPKNGSTREEQTLALLDRFKLKLTKAISETPEEEPVQPEGEDDQGWMSHILQFEEQTRKVKDANMQDEDTFEIHDPRNPVNKRRREESKKIMKEKKERR
ncbi:spliceosome-associated protein CWC27 homolog isoform X1 [Carcharodon carcharias]|uniref:spliceosome-associated protein CWC27 homolog isoform X1 n=1 Tax=Carcharodon carcharias TaxID=13397 RepID=UPI001B7E4C18|nr:spliceosome-associated protein CWC27 homolog isoform X1 [Carcharodon carcharias]